MPNKITEKIKAGIIEDQIYFLPEGQIERKLYVKISNHLKFLGGKWNRGKGGFIFDRTIESIEELLTENAKKEIQFFETPKEIAKELCELAEIDNYSAPILEPSAGRGAIIKQIQKVSTCRINYCEINEVNQKYLDELSGIEKVGKDFLKLGNKKKYSRIIANPPFSKNQDIDHILKMHSLLSENGILVSVASPHWGMASEKKCVEFRRFLDLTNADIHDIASGGFKDSGTMTRAKIVVIKKNLTN